MRNTEPVDLWPLRSRITVPNLLCEGKQILLLGGVCSVLIQQQKCSLTIAQSVKVKVKVKVTLEQATKARRGSRGIARGEFRPRQTRQLPRAVDLKGRLLSCQSY